MYEASITIREYKSGAIHVRLKTDKADDHEGKSSAAGDLIAALADILNCPKVLNEASQKSPVLGVFVEGAFERWYDESPLQ